METTSDLALQPRCGLLSNYFDLLFKLIWHFGEFQAVFCVLSSLKMLNFPLEWSWWMLKMYFWEILMDNYEVHYSLTAYLLRFNLLPSQRLGSTFYCIVIQAVWCLKFWNMTKIWGTVCISAPHSSFSGPTWSGSHLPWFKCLILSIRTQPVANWKMCSTLAWQEVVSVLAVPVIPSHTQSLVHQHWVFFQTGLLQCTCPAERHGIPHGTGVISCC